MNRLKTILFASIALISAMSCDDEKNDPVLDRDAKHILALSLPAIESYPFHLIGDATSGTADISQSQEIPNIPDNVPVTTQQGFIFLNSADRLTKYSVDADGYLQNEGELPNLGISGGPVYEFLSNNRLLISTGPRANESGVFDYQIVNTTTMTEESKGTIALPIDENSTAIPSNYILKEGKVYVPYIHTDLDYAAYDKAPVAIFDAVTMAYEKTIYEERTASLGYSVVSSHGFAENGDLYLISCNSNYWAANEELPSGIARINAGESEFDEDYFFNITAKVDGNHTGGMLYVGNNKAIIQVFNGDLITEYRDYQNAYVIDYYLADLSAQTVEKLDLPTSKYPRKALELLKDGTAAIVINSEQDNAIYIFDPADNSVTKGLTYTGAEYINAFMTFE
ncbi:MAG TPA: DUF4374 domain-containing protein [Ohtaekwangia sp.]|nr:DUF4374 domain-containing protein [Ohtaekwangia sp.]